MDNTALKSPCHNCGIHFLGFDKKDARYPCESCHHRLAYVDRVADYQPYYRCEEPVVFITRDSSRFWEQEFGFHKKVN